MPHIRRVSLERVAREARACRMCEAALPHAPNPVFRVGRGARLLIVGQAPGRRVHETGIPWNDPSGDTLRSWLDIDRARFYDTTHIAIVPTGLTVAQFAVRSLPSSADSPSHRAGGKKVHCRKGGA